MSGRVEWLENLRRRVLAEISREAHQGADRTGEPCFCEERCELVYALWNGTASVFSEVKRTITEEEVATPAPERTEP